MAEKAKVEGMIEEVEGTIKGVRPEVEGTIRKLRERLTELRV